MEIKKLLLQSEVLHADETGVNTNGKQNRIHVLSNKRTGFFEHHRKRGKEVIDEFDLIPLYKGNLVHDRFSSYFSYNCEHSLCNAHILRELVYMEEALGGLWAKEIRKLLITANSKKKRGKGYAHKHYSRIVKKHEEFIRPILDKHNDTYTKIKEEKSAFALEKHKHLFLEFIKQA